MSEGGRAKKALCRGRLATSADAPLKRPASRAKPRQQLFRCDPFGSSPSQALPPRLSSSQFAFERDHHRYRPVKVGHCARAPTSPHVFISERRAPLSAAGYQRMVARAGVAAKFTFLVHSHMLRHACGFKLANDGHDTRAIQAYLGHRSIMSTVRYTALTPNRFRNFWKD